MPKHCAKNDTRKRDPCVQTIKRGPQIPQFIHFQNVPLWRPGLFGLVIGMRHIAAQKRFAFKGRFSQEISMSSTFPENLIILTGGPGAGKTTLINALHKRG